MKRNHDWNPTVGHLVIYRGDKLVYTVLEVNRTGYGWTDFVVYKDGKIANLSTLNCDPVEHFLSAEYDNNNHVNKEKV